MPVRVWVIIGSWFLLNRVSVVFVPLVFRRALPCMRVVIEMEPWHLSAVSWQFHSPFCLAISLGKVRTACNNVEVLSLCKLLELLWPVLRAVVAHNHLKYPMSSKKCFHCLMIWRKVHCSQTSGFIELEDLWINSLPRILSKWCRHEWFFGWNILLDPVWAVLGKLL